MNYVDVHTHQLNRSINSISIKNYFPTDVFETDSYYSAGIHPWFLDINSIENDLFLIENQLKNQNCIAIGECGLDRMCKTDFEIQKIVFTQQLQLANKYQKPVIIHCVKAHQELIEIVKKEHINVPLILHGFSKKKAIHQLFLQMPTIYFSFGKSLISSKTTQQNLIDTPLYKLFLETDDSNLTIKDLYWQTSIIKNIPLEFLKNQVFLNFQKVFKKE